MWCNLLMADSIDFRKKVLACCERTGSMTEASHVFQISRNTIYGWLRLKERTGELNHQVKGTVGSGKLLWLLIFLHSCVTMLD